METSGGAITRTRQRGFSMVELLITVAIFTIVMAVVVNGVVVVQQRNSSEVRKLDLTEESRQFMDQIVNDIHQAGYPSLKMFDPAGGTTSASNTVAKGLIAVSSTAVQFEADVDGTGVSEVYIQLVIPSGGCPCTLERGTISKTLSLLGQTPLYYTEVTNIMNTNVFAAYEFDGDTIPLPASASDLLLIKVIKMTVYARSPISDTPTGVYPSTTMVTEAKINN